MAQIYCAGPLFTKGECGEMEDIASLLEIEKKHETFLPQRDGLELKDLEPIVAKILGNESEARHLVNKAIFCFDLHKLLGWSEGVVANMNGRVPDEGTIVETAMAWHAGKALVIYKDDPRAPFNGHDNPMLTGLTEDYFVKNLYEIPTMLDQRLSECSTSRPIEAMEFRVRQTIEAGGEIAKELPPIRNDPNAVAKMLVKWGS